MKNNRRNFLRLSGLAGLGLTGGGIFKGFASQPSDEPLSLSADRFNMSGYAESPRETVRTGFIGLGNRGPTHLQHISKIAGVEIKALCDIRPEKVRAASNLIQKTGNNPIIYTEKSDAWKKLCEQKDIDLVYIATPWHLHTPMAVYAMQQGKHVAVEVPAAVTVEECWQLVETSEKTRKHCILLENCCYDFFELLTLNMARQGFFGEIVHTEGAYIHDLLGSNFSKTKYYESWRLKENATRNGDLYPTHGLGPIAQVMNINRGDKMDYLVSMSGNDFMMNKTAKDLATKDDFYRQFANRQFRGNMNTTTIRTNQGKTIMLQHDVTSPRVYSRIHMISGTKGTAQKYPLPARISGGDDKWFSEQEIKTLEEQYSPPLVKKIGEMAKQIGGHGGMDFLMNWRLIDNLHNGLPLDIDVYDTALWSAVGPLSERSVANRSNSTDIPDFTGGTWKKNKPVDLSLEKGGNTKLKA